MVVGLLDFLEVLIFLSLSFAFFVFENGYRKNSYRYRRKPINVNKSPTVNKSKS